jgi:hypothetical protein
MKADCWVWPTLDRQVVGRPQSCVEEWERRGAPKMWLQILWYGLNTPVDEGANVSSLRWGKTQIRDAHQRRWIRQEILRLQATGAIIKCQKEDLEFCSSVFLVPKTGPKLYRMVVNMKPVNPAWEQQETAFKMEGLKGFLMLAYPGAWTLVWDLAEGYFHVMLSAFLSRYFGIELDGQHFMYTVLTFGWSRSMYFFNTLMEVAKRHWRKEFGVIVWSHVDDFCSVHSSKAEAISIRDRVLGPEMDALGLVREPSKGSWDHPTQQPMIYGFLVDLAWVSNHGLGLITIPDHKVEDLSAVLQTVMDAAGAAVSGRFMAKAAGKIVSCQEDF